MKHWLLIISLLTSCFFYACRSDVEKTSGFGYDLMHPVNEFELPQSLREISGITFYSENKIACIQDEKGKIYLYNLKKKEVKEIVNFGEDHDYEAISFVNDTFYVLRNTGTLYEITNLGTDAMQSKKHDTFLKKENNTEGLCYDNLTQQLLIACKGASVQDWNEDVKEIYSFDPAIQSLNTKPVYSIKLRELHQLLKANNMTLPEGENKHSFFEPSEIAVDPLTNDIYVLSSTGKLMVVMDRTGTLREAAKFDPEIAAQPEGMTFSENGNLFISSEGKGKKKVILEFSRRGKNKY